MTSAIVKLNETIENRAPDIAKNLPGHIRPERFIRTAKTAIAFTRNIENATAASLLRAVSNAAADGLILDGREAALVIDFKGEAQYRPMMRGLLKLAYQSGKLSSVKAEVVRENDLFEYEPSSLDSILHKIDLRKPRGNVYAFYAKAVFKDGTIVTEVMSIDDVNRIRDRSDAYKAFKAGRIKSTPWSTDPDEMGKKTVFRRLSKWLPASTDAEERLLQAAERIDADYTFEERAVPADTEEPKRKGRKSAAQKLAEAQESEPEMVSEPEPDHTQDIIDNETGEVYEPGESPSGDVF